MYTNDDHETADIGDRLIAAAIGGFLGFFIGGVFGFLALKILGSSYGLAWIVAAICALFAFISPSRSREIWSQFWEEFLGLMSSRK